MQKAENLENYYRIPADNRDLNYQKYFTEGEQEIEKMVDYNSDNTQRLGVEELKKLLLQLPYIKNECNNLETQQ